MNPLALIAELTHRCPLHCVYCSNPRELESRARELPTETWSRLFREAAEAGVLHVDLTGGEPLVRTDIVGLVESARSAGLYVNLITSGVPLDESKLDALVAAGLDHFQLSFQAADEVLAAAISNTRSHAQKLRVLEWLKSRRVALTLNFVLHRHNLEQLPQMLALAESSSATRVEFAHAQYYGWAFANRERLLPTRAQLDDSLAFFRLEQQRLAGKIRVEYVVPDYYARYPKPCMGGWGRKLILVTPSGEALPCHAAKVIPGLKFENVNEQSLGEIWRKSPSFERFRGQSWMQEPCRSCDRRDQDFAGCRCQAMLLAGDPAATDPVCSLSPVRQKVDALLAPLNPARASDPSPGGPEPTGRADAPRNIAWLYRPHPG
jgi:pyrroloquinoline quinone biosynthesis protein E